MRERIVWGAGAVGAGLVVVHLVVGAALWWLGLTGAGLLVLALVALHVVGAHGVLHRAAGGAIRLALRLGVRLGTVVLLTVRGRRSGKARTNPVDLFERDGRRWLVATHTAEANWVRNLRAAGEGTLARGGREDAFAAVELPLAEAESVLREVVGPRLAKPVGGFVLRRSLGVPDPAKADFTALAAAHPVFELTAARDAKGISRDQKGIRRA